MLWSSLDIVGGWKVHGTHCPLGRELRPDMPVVNWYWLMVVFPSGSSGVVLQFYSLVTELSSKALLST